MNGYNARAIETSVHIIPFLTNRGSSSPSRTPWSLSNMIPYGTERMFTPTKKIAIKKIIDMDLDTFVVLEFFIPVIVSILRWAFVFIAICSRAVITEIAESPPNPTACAIMSTSLEGTKAHEPETTPTTMIMSCPKNEPVKNAPITKNMSFL